MEAVVCQEPYKADAYDKFDKRIDGYTKVVLKPGMSAR